MEIVPDVVFDFPSDAEERVFRLLTSVSLGSEWTAYHSLNLSEHEYKVWAEIDFLLIGPEVALVLEIKGGGIRRDQGVWLYRDRFGVEHRNSEGPFNQAKSAMYALRERLAEHHRLPVVRDGHLLFGWGVVFPDINWRVDTPEHPAELVADRTDLADAGAFERYVTRLKKYWESKLGRREGATSNALKDLRLAIRPDVDLYPPLTAHVGRVLSRMQRLTDEQYERMAIIRANRRAIVSGGAGTGKTFLAMQLARRELALDQSVLLIVSSPVLAAWLRRLEPDRRMEVVAFDDLDDEGEFDVLIVDEGQDLVDIDVFSVLSGGLKDGLVGGRWYWFMDENRQAGLRGVFDREAFEYLASGFGGTAVARIPLTENVRNTFEVVERVETWTGAVIGHSRRAGHGRKPRVIPLSDSGGLCTALGELVDELLEEGADPEAIGIVYPDSFDASVLFGLDRRVRRRLIPLDLTSIRSELRGRIVHGRVGDFKGLERPIAICVGFDDPALLEDGASELYVAATRANYGLYLLSDVRFVGELMNRRVAK